MTNGGSGEPVALSIETARAGPWNAAADEMGGGSVPMGNRFEDSREKRGLLRVRER
jgi:hypothetical protein